jgi:HEPN domain-containing protein
MENKIVLEWFCFADADLDSARILKNAYKQHREIICYHCQQAVEKYLKGFLETQGIIPPKIHVLETLCALCSEKDEMFNEIARDCAYLSTFAVQSRYPHGMEITDANVEKALSIAEKVSLFAPIYTLKEKLTTPEESDVNNPEKADTSQKAPR